MTRVSRGPRCQIARLFTQLSSFKWSTLAVAVCFFCSIIRDFQLRYHVSIQHRYIQDAEPEPPAEASASANIVPTPLSTNVIQLNIPNMSLAPIYVNGCCGIGHRLSRIIPTITYANNHLQTVHAVWSDVPWSALFNNTDYVQARERMGKQEDNNYRNSYPTDWDRDVDNARRNIVVESGAGTVFDRYADSQRQAMDMPVAQAILVSMRDSLSPLVLSHLDSIRQQTHDNELDAALNNVSHVKVCVHVRQGNNETGDWARKTWRHIDLPSLLNNTRGAMEDFVTTFGEGTPKNNAHHRVSLFVASDSVYVRPWFETNSPKGWRVIMPGKELPKPESGVWFGEHGSKTSHVLNQTMKNEVMAEATAEIFALGECDALFIPNYSSFTLSSIILTRARKKPVFFRKYRGLGFREMSTILKLSNAKSQSKTSSEFVVNSDHRRLILESKQMERVVCDDEL